MANPSSSHPMESLYSSCMRMEGRFFKNQTYVDTVYIYIERCVCMYVCMCVCMYGMVWYGMVWYGMVCMYVMLCFVLFCNVMYVCNVMYCFVL